MGIPESPPKAPVLTPHADLDRAATRVIRYADEIVETIFHRLQNFLPMYRNHARKIALNVATDLLRKEQPFEPERCADKVMEELKAKEV